MGNCCLSFCVLLSVVFCLNVYFCYIVRHINNNIRNCSVYFIFAFAIVFVAVIFVLAAVLVIVMMIEIMQENIYQEKLNDDKLMCNRGRGGTRKVLASSHFFL